MTTPARASALSSLPPTGPAGGTSAGLQAHHQSLFTLVVEYMDRVIPSGRAMKVLLVDNSTLHMVSTSFSQTALLNKSVFLVDSISDHGQRGHMKTMSCIMFIRPESASVDAACKELQLAKYMRFSIVFSAAATPEFIERLARADVDLLVDRVEEVFCDFCAVNQDAFTIEVPASLSSSTAIAAAGLTSAAIANAHVRRVAEGLAALIVAQHRKPYVRYQRSSAYARRVATELASVLRGDPELYDYRPRDTTLLILDRSADPLTPLLSPWTYQAMLHEYVGLTHNTLRLPPDVKGAEEDGYVFSQQDDLFFSANMFSNYGDLCNNVKAYVQKCKAALNLDRESATLEEMKEYMEKIAETKSLAGSVSKHGTVTTYLSSLVSKRDLLQVSLLEQNMNAASNANEHWTRLQSFATRPGLDQSDLTRLCLIYNLRYEKTGQPSREALYLDRVSSTHGQIIKRLREYYGEEKPTDGLFAEEDGVMASLKKTFGEVENVYTQHEPVLKRTLMQLYSGRLDMEQYPYLSTGPSLSAKSQSHQPSVDYKAHEAVVFMCGGYTFEEAALINSINKRTAYKSADVANFGVPGGAVRAILGGERVLNSSTFMKLLMQ